MNTIQYPDLVLTLLSFCSHLIIIYFPCLQPPASKPNHRLVFQTQLSIYIFFEIQPNRESFKRSMDLENSFPLHFKSREKLFMLIITKYATEEINPKITLLINSFNSFVC